MIKLWSELPAARSREVAADIATVIWVAFWGSIVWQLFQFLSSFAQAGRSVRDGGNTMVQGGRDLGESLAGLPVVGTQVRDIAAGAFASAGTPISSFGIQLEQFIFIIAAVLALILALVTLQPWLVRYLPWRWERLHRLRSAHRAIRISPAGTDTATERVLAMRAVSRLEYATLLEYSDDPLGDWANGRHDRLARAELASVGLRP
ncbi:MAG: hypothetical protein ABI553_08370 [Chloroflexota bacterium]